MKLSSKSKDAITPFCVYLQGSAMDYQVNLGQHLQKAQHRQAHNSFICHAAGPASSSDELHAQ